MLKHRVGSSGAQSGSGEADRGSTEGDHSMDNVGSGYRHSAWGRTLQETGAGVWLGKQLEPGHGNLRARCRR